MAELEPTSPSENFARRRCGPASGVPESFARLVEDYYQPAYRFAFSLSGNHNDACDITQQAFYIAHTRSHQLRDPAKLKQWLFTILHREYLRIRRREIAHPQTTLEFSEQSLPLIHVDHAASLDSYTVLNVLETLDENFRMPLTLFYLDQLSYKEIATALDVPIGTVMSRLARGKQMLRQRLEERRVEDTGKIVPLRQVAGERGSDG
jgi:RNA polymerase sigma-70 factor (ECF subfamily)